MTSYFSIPMIGMSLILVWTTCTGSSEKNMNTPTEYAFTQHLPDGFDVQGHRGARGLKPENTLQAVETALDLGVTTLELDLHYSADGIVVIWHDDKITAAKCELFESAGVASPDPDDPSVLVEAFKISRLTYAQLQKYSCNRNPDPARFPAQNNEATQLAGDSFQIVSLEKLLEFVNNYSKSELKNNAQRSNASRVSFNIETKRSQVDETAIGDNFDGVNPGDFELEILRIVGDWKIESRTAVQSFDHRSLWAIRSVNKSIELAALTFREKVDLNALASNGATIWSMYSKTLTTELIDEAHDLGMRVYPWTVNDANTMKTMINMGVDGLITDRPDTLLSLGF